MIRYKRFRFVHLGALLVLGLLLTGCSADTAPIEEQPTTNTATSSESAVSYETFPLPQPILDGETSVSEALFERRSQRDFQDTELTQEQLAQLLWAAAGVTTEDGRRTAPSAGTLYPLDLYVVVTQVRGLEPGLYLYQPEQHTLAKVLAGDFRTALAEGSLDQPAIQRAPATLLYTVVYERLIERYGDRGIERYAYIEVGHSAQNVLLQAQALGLGAVPIGAFTDYELKELLELPTENEPRYLIPVGVIE